MAPAADIWRYWFLPICSNNFGWEYPAEEISISLQDYGEVLGSPLLTNKTVFEDCLQRGTSYATGATDRDGFEE